MKSKTALPVERNISQETKAEILERYVPADWKTAPFCVDGRAGERVGSKGEKSANPYPQALGGSLNIAVLNWILNGKDKPFLSLTLDAFSKLEDKGFSLGVHTGSHTDYRTKSDCGFADNLGEILDITRARGDGIWRILVETSGELKERKEQWERFMDLIGKIDLSSIPSGFEIISRLKNQEGVYLQNLAGDHREVVAFVNSKQGTSLDTDNNQNEEDNTQAFNLDIWYVRKQAETLGLDFEQADLFTLGLYVATEMKLVEEKKGYRLPIIVR